MSQNVPKNIVWACFDWFSRRRKALPSAPWRLKKIPQKSKKFQFFKNVQKRFQKCPNLFWGEFFEVFIQCTLEGRDVEKFQKMDKLSNFQNPGKRFQKCPNLIWGVFLPILFLPRAPWRSKLGKNWKKFEKVLEFQKCPKMFLKLSKLVFNLFWGKFFEEERPSAPLRVDTWNNFKKLEKISIFQNAQKRSQKRSNMFSTCSEVIFSVKKFCTVHPGWSKFGKRSKNWKNFETFKIVQKGSQKHCLSMFCLITSTEKSSAQCTLETQKKSTKIEIISNFHECPKLIPRVSKLVLKWFFRDFLASAPWRVETSKNFKKWKNIRTFKTPENVSRNVQTSFELVSR